MHPHDWPYTSNDAWERAWRLRCCPPDNRLRTEAETENVSRHLAVCPWCRQTLQMDREDVSLESFKRLGQAPDDEPRPGELWAVKADLGGWGDKSRYYAPPVVLILSISDDFLVQALQVYDDPVLAGLGDVLLGDAVDGFAETWNQYSLHVNDLSFRLGAVLPRILAICRDTSDKEQEPIEPGSLLWFFRNMEVETGFFFARKTVLRVLQDISSNGQGRSDPAVLPGRENLSNLSLSVLREQLTRLGLRCQTDDTVDAASWVDVLASVGVPDVHLPLAAAGEQDEMIALVFTSRDGEISDYEISRFTLNQMDIQDTTVLLSGAFLEPVPVFHDFFCRLKTTKGLLMPEPGSCGVQEGIFWATFSFTEIKVLPRKSDVTLYFIRYE